MEIGTKTYKTKEIAEILGISLDSVHGRCSRQKINPVKVIKGIHYYTLTQFNRKVETVVVYYPLKTTETFYIYESKLNTIEL